MTAETKEAVARAICKAIGLDPDKATGIGPEWPYWTDAAHAAIVAIDAARDVPADDEPWQITAMRAIDRLRDEEGDSVTIRSNNRQYFDSSIQVAIDCNGWWTGYRDLRIKGRTFLECLTKAVEAKDQRTKSEGAVS